MQQLKYAVSITDEAVGINTPIMLYGSFESCFKTAAQCGYDGVELQIKNPATKDVAELRRLKKAYGLEIPAITTGMEYFGNHLSLISEDESVQDNAVKRLAEHIDLAAELGSMVLVGSMRGNITDWSEYGTVEARLIKNLKRVADAAAKKNVTVVFEPINLYIINYFCNLDESAELVRKVSSPAFQLMIDTHHMCMHDGNLYEAIRRNEKWIRYVHYSDSNRYYPGGGNIDFLQCTKALLDGGYDGWITMECLALKDGKKSAERALNYSRALETACRAVRD